MANAFGGSWIGQYGTSEEQAFQTWSGALENYSPAQIERGVRNSLDGEVWGREFPPNLSQFAKLCLTERRYPKNYHRPFLSEPEIKRSTPERAKAELTRLMRMLEGREEDELTFEQHYNRLGLNQRSGQLPPERRNI